jgi:polar amino acid transport system substrate-binding protein
LAAALAMSAGCSSVQEAPFSSEPPAAEASDGEATSAPVDDDPNCDPNRVDESLGPPRALADFDRNADYLGEIRSRGVLRAGVGVDTLQFGSVDPEGNIVGFDVEFARLVADELRVDLELIPVQSADRIEAIRSGRVDLVVKTMTITCQRWAQVNFSSVYFNAGQRVLLSADDDLVPADLPDLAAPRPDGSLRVICAVDGTTSLANLTAAGVATTTAPSWTGCLVALQLGEADGISTDDTILAGLAVQDPKARIVGGTFSAEPYGIALPPDQPAFTEFVNAVLQQARDDGTWQDLYATWLADVLGPSPSVPVARYRS